MRSTVFNIFFLVATFVYAFVAVIFSLIPGRALMMGSLRRYTRLMVWALRVIAGIKVNVSGHEHIPADGAIIIASKHQSYGDGHVLFSQFDDLTFVTGDHITKFLFIKRILAKMNAVVIDSCGGEKVREKFDETARIVREQGRRILIFPEGHLSEIGTHHRYRKGVWHLYHQFGCPVVPVASNLGQRWNQNDWAKHKGEATMEFLEPIEPGMEKDAFMQVLQERIESRSLELLDMENLGALNPENIGKLDENESAQENRKRREAGDCP